MNRYLSTSSNENNTTSLDLNFDSTKVTNLTKSNTSKDDAKGILSRVKCFKVIEKVKTKKGLTDMETAMALITGLLQRGGSNKNAGNTSLELSVTSSLLTG
jgi:hypothetical protein